MSEQSMDTTAALDAFAARLSALLKEIIECVVNKAVVGALADGEEPDEDYGIYHEIDYDDIEGMLTPLAELGITLSYEKLSEFLNEHPDVNYTDPHNTVITVYLNESAMLRAPEQQPRKTERKGTLAALLTSGILLKNVELCGKKRDPLSEIVVQRLDGEILDKVDLTEWGDVLNAPVLEIYPWQHDYMVAVLDCDPGRVISFSKLLKRIDEEESFGHADSPGAGMKPLSL